MKDEDITRERGRWIAWIEVIGTVLVAFGVFMAVANTTGAFDFLRNPINTAFFGDRQPDAAAADFQAWAYAMWGASVAGWGIAVVALARFGIGNGHRWAWAAMVLSLAVWFPLDTWYSFSHGVTFNGVLNIAIAVALAIPLAMTRRSTK